MSSATRYRLAIWAAILLALTHASLRADQIQLQNGDRYAGKIVSMTSNSIVMESDVLGKVTLPRNKVTSMMFGASATTNSVAAVPSLSTATAVSPKTPATTTDLSGALHNLGANTNFIQQVRQQMLTGADPAANAKYDELVGGLMTGKVSLNDLRNQAKTSIDQINQLKKELGPDAGDQFDSYLSILQSFVNEAPSTTPTAPVVTATPAAPVASFSTNSTSATPDN